MQKKSFRIFSSHPADGMLYRVTKGMTFNSLGRLIEIMQHSLRFFAKSLVNVTYVSWNLSTVNQYRMNGWYLELWWRTITPNGSSSVASELKINWIKTAHSLTHCLHTCTRRLCANTHNCSMSHRLSTEPIKNLASWLLRIMSFSLTPEVNNSNDS